MLKSLIKGITGSVITPQVPLHNIDPMMEVGLSLNGLGSQEIVLRDVRSNMFKGPQVLSFLQELGIHIVTGI